MASVSSSRDKVARCPKCARCRNHGLVVQLKGHAGNCSFSRCNCWKCALISERTRIMATQRRMRRGKRVHVEPSPGSADGTTKKSPGQDEEAQIKAYTEPELPVGGARAPTPEPVNQRAVLNTAQRYVYYRRSPEESRDRPLLRECAVPGTLQKSVYSADLMAMPLPFQLYGQNTNAYLCPSFLMTSPPVGTTGFPHLPPGALMQWPDPGSPQEGPGFFYAPYPSYLCAREGCCQLPDHHQRESANVTATESVPRNGHDSGPDEGTRGENTILQTLLLPESHIK